MADQIFSLIKEPFTKYVMEPIIAKCRVSKDLGNNIKALKTTKEKLYGKRKSEEEKLEEEKKQKGVKASGEAEIWFNHVDKAISDANNLIAEYEDHKSKRKDLSWLQQCPNYFCSCFSRYPLSKRALELKQDVEKLHDGLKSGLTAALTSQKGRELPIVCIEGQSTTEKLKRDIIDAVVDDRNVVVGLYGLGGVGKTTLIQHVYNHFRKTDNFKSVIFATVSATPNFAEIRYEIARSLGLKVEKNEDDKNVKEKLSRLSGSVLGKYLLILDDMWEPPIKIDEICIPAPNKGNGCKILMASRSKSVVIRFVNRFAEKDCLKSIRVNCLPPEEAWNLFVQKVGVEITCKPEIKPLAEEVVRKCDGLPLAITVVGRTMATRETEGEWKDAVRELEQSASKFEDIEEEVFSKLIFSFEKLQPIEQSLFLYCCLYPEDICIKRWDILKFAIGEETIVCSDMQYKLEEVRNKIDVLIGKLQKSSMLEDAGDGDVQMHDVMRELAVWITSSNRYHFTTKLKFIAKARCRLSEAPHASEWSQANKISLMDNWKIESLPELPHLCPQLHTLLLQRCSGIKEIPQVHFLDHMPVLQILDLSWTGIKNLPPSICNLVNLRFLCLGHCVFLEELPPEIGMLLQLIWLDLDCCNCLRKLPVEMKKLKNLRYLRLKNIPRGVLSGLHKLEQLHAGELDFNRIMELSQLTCLTKSRIQRVKIKKVKVSHWLWPLISRSQADLVMWNCNIDPSAQPVLLEYSQDEDWDIQMVFKSCKGLTRVLTHGCTSLTIQDCPDLKAILMVEEEVERRNMINAFQRLDELNLDRLHQLERMCIGIPQPGSTCFTNLTSISIQECPNLKVLFTKGVTQLLTMLKTLVVWRCSQLVELVAVSDDDNDDANDDAFPSLENISLCELSELTTICDLDLKWPSLEEAHIYDCPKLRRPPFGARRADVSLDDEIDSEVTKEYLDYFDEKRQVR